MDKEDLHGKMDHIIKETLSIILLKEKEKWYFLMEIFTKVHGKITKCMEKGNLNGKMADITKDNINKIKNKDMVDFLYLMEEYMKESGKWSTTWSRKI